MSTKSTTRCEFCENADESVATRTGRGAMVLCDTCDAWISERMREMTVVVPDEVRADATASAVDRDAERTLGFNPDLGVAEVLEFATTVSYEAIGQLEAAGFETVEDLWTADREDLADVPHVHSTDIDAIFEAISTTPDRDLDDLPGFEDVEDDGDHPR